MEETVTKQRSDYIDSSKAEDFMAAFIAFLGILACIFL